MIGIEPPSGSPTDLHFKNFVGWGRQITNLSGECWPAKLAEIGQAPLRDPCHVLQAQGVPQVRCGRALLVT
jgi:hypothetical protein